MCKKIRDDSHAVTSVALNKRHFANSDHFRTITGIYATANTELLVSEL